MQMPFKLAANLWKASKSEISKDGISYDRVVIEGYRTKKSYGKLFLINLQSEVDWEHVCLSQKTT